MTLPNPPLKHPKPYTLLELERFGAMYYAYDDGWRRSGDPHEEITRLFATAAMAFGVGTTVQAERRLAAGPLGKSDNERNEVG